MTTTPADPTSGTAQSGGRGAVPAPVAEPVVGLNKSGSSVAEWELRELLGPFVAWLATQDLDEAERRRHREAAERFLRWAHADGGRAEDRRRRYERYLDRHDPDHLPDARAGVDWWSQHRLLLARTLLADG